MICRLTGACAAGTVRFTTISMSGSASSVSTGTACTRVFCCFRLGRIGANVGNRLHPDQPRSRRAAQIGVADTAAADDADDRWFHAAQPCNSTAMRSSRGRSEPGRTACHARRPSSVHRSRDRSATARANPARRRRHRPSRPRPALCRPVRCPSRARRPGDRDSAAAIPPVRRRRAPAMPRRPATPAECPRPRRTTARAQSFAPSFGFSSQLWLW